MVWDDIEGSLIKRDPSASEILCDALTYHDPAYNRKPSGDPFVPLPSLLFGCTPSTDASLHFAVQDKDLVSATARLDSNIRNDRV